MTRERREKINHLLGEEKKKLKKIFMPNNYVQVMFQRLQNLRQRGKFVDDRVLSASISK